MTPEYRTDEQVIVTVKTSAGDWYLYKGEFRKEKLPRTCDGTVLEGGGYISTHWPVPKLVFDLIRLAA